jgi:hypothetical protein
MHGKIKHIKHGKIISVKVKKNEVYKSELWTSETNVCILYVIDLKSSLELVL